ncbi:hypothetical protein PTKIN_Ptkin02bG0131800 [Pterospermum kingtungense]
MASFRISRAASRGLLGPSLYSSLSIFSLSQSSSTTITNPNFFNAFTRLSHLFPNYENSRDHFKVSKENLSLFRPGIAWISTSSGVADSSNKGSNNNKNVAEVRSWIEVYLPRAIQPYAKLARLDKPIGTWLLAWPCMWSITLASPPGHLPDFKMMALFGCGALLLRGAGCTINDLLDRDIDSMLYIGGVILVASLFLSFDEEIYILGWSAIKGSVDPSIVFPLYFSGVLWTLVYDTIYAHQDKEDDVKVGVKSTALRFGDSTKEWTAGFGILCISSLALSGFNADIGWPYYACLAAASGQLAWQIWTVNLTSRADCNRKFVSNKWFGALIFSGILFGRVFS